MPEYNSAFDALDRTPEEKEQLKFRAAALRTLRAHIRKQEWKLTEAAEHLEVTPTQISDLMRGKVSSFTVYKLASMLDAAGLEES